MRYENLHDDIQWSEKSMQVNVSENTDQKKCPGGRSP